jgi:thiol-disulfide isomerase/thioredoxin
MQWNKWMGTLIVLAVLISFQACIVVENPFEGLPPGKWRGVLKLAYRPVSSNPKGEPLPEKMNLSFEEVTDGELPFNFDVIHREDGSFYIEIINGEERIKVEDIQFGIDRSTAKDTVVINFPVYDSYIKAIFEENIMEGDWIVNNRGTDYRIPFVARQGRNHRFTPLKKTPVLDVSGKWETTFGINETDPYKAIAEFQQNGNHLTGTFRTETGDYRFLEGTVQNNKMYLSCFDGAHAFLFEAKIQEDSTLIGSFRSGKHYQTIWSAKRNPDFELASADTLTYLKEGYKSFDFSFENPEGEVISLNDETYQGKVRIIQILGTWCPNCRDETLFLKDYLTRNPNEDLAIIGLAFERYKDEAKAKEVIKTYKEKMGLEYEILYAGSSNKKEASKALPMLNEIISYPTMIFVDKSGEVRRIHTGFSGPATSTYAKFKTDFETYISELLNE